MRYTQEQISTALVLLKATGSPDKVVQTLGYPSAPMLYHWRKKYPEYYGSSYQMWNGSGASMYRGDRRRRFKDTGYFD